MRLDGAGDGSTATCRTHDLRYARNGALRAYAHIELHLSVTAVVGELLSSTDEDGGRLYREQQASTPMILCLVSVSRSILLTFHVVRTGYSRQAQR